MQAGVLRMVGKVSFEDINHCVNWVIALFFIVAFDFTILDIVSHTSVLSVGFPPASTSKIFHSGFSLSLLATTEPAAPAPNTMKS